MTIEATPPPAASPPAAPPPPPAGAAPPTQATPPPAPPATPASEPREGDEPAWAKNRLERAKEAGRREALREIGVEDPKDAKTAIEAHRALLEANKTELQKAQEKAALADQLSRENGTLRASLESHARVALAALTTEQRAAVEQIAGSDPTRVISAIEALRGTWQAAPSASPAASAAGPSATPAAPPAGPPPLPAGANTAPPAGAPQAPSGGPVDHLARWESLKRTDPFGAANYLLRHTAEITKARSARG